MKDRFRLFRRGWGTYYVEDVESGKQQTLQTTDKREAQRMVHARNEAQHTPYCPKTRACTFSSRLAVIVTQDSTQALAAFDRAIPRERIELGPDDLVLRPLVVSFLVIMEEEI